jgi:hypothetical protein
MTETEAPAADPTAPRGRPRPDTTIERDEKVLAAITEAPGTRKQLVERLGMAGNEVYLSLYRLSRATPPKIIKNGSTWQTPDYVAPEPAPEAPVAPTE